jgi:uncharacterized protein YdhG (YjbR/CyaY superfamily)
MAKTDYQSVDEYLAALPAATREVLERVRATIRAALPGAEERISYQIPAYRLNGATVVYCAGWKEHIAVYPIGDALLTAFGDELEPYVVSKGTLRFPLAAPMPLDLIGRVASFRADEALARRAAKKERKAKSKAAAEQAAAEQPATEETWEEEEE